jgi:HPr kinase/phosphorylase
VNVGICHATAITIGGSGVLLTGPSGSGKSDLALRLIDRGAELICDDAVVIEPVNGCLILSPAPNIDGKLELRGIGICKIPSASTAPLRLVAALASDVERMPSFDCSTMVSGYDVPLIRLAAFEISAAIKLEYALRAVIDAERWPVARTSSYKAESKRRDP